MAISKIKVGSTEHELEATKATRAVKLETHYMGNANQTYGAQYPLYAQWDANDRLHLKVDGYVTEADHATKLVSSDYSKNKSAALLSVGSATKPVYFSGGVPVACTLSTQEYYEVSEQHPLGLISFEDFEYFAGKPDTDTDTTYTVSTGDSNGQIKVKPSSGSAYNVSVKGLGSAAYTASTAYATSAQGTKADNALPKTGGTVSGNITITNGSSSQANEPNFKWKTVGSNTPYVGFATDQSDGTFLLGSLRGTNYQSGLAIGGGSGNLLWKGERVATADDVSAVQTKLNSKTKSLQVTLSSGSWSNKSQTVTASGVTANNIVIVAPDPNSQDAYVAAGVKCTAQASNSLTFKCETAPTSNLTVNIVVIN